MLFLKCYPWDWFHLQRKHMEQSSWLFFFSFLTITQSLHPGWTFFGSITDMFREDSKYKCNIAENNFLQLSLGIAANGYFV